MCACQGFNSNHAQTARFNILIPAGAATRQFVVQALHRCCQHTTALALSPHHKTTTHTHTHTHTHTQRCVQPGSGLSFWRHPPPPPLLLRMHGAGLWGEVGHTRLQCVSGRARRARRAGGWTGRAGWAGGQAITLGRRAGTPPCRTVSAGVPNSQTPTPPRDHGPLCPSLISALVRTTVLFPATFGTPVLFSPEGGEG